MIKVTKKLTPDRTNYILGELIDDYYSESKNAFIGECGNGPTNSLYLVTHSSIVLLENPSLVWSDFDCQVCVYKFVDLEIIMHEKDIT